MIFLDVNVFIDVLSAREGYEAGASIIESISEGKESGCLSALTIPIVWYVMGESKESIKDIKALIKHFKIIPLNSQMIEVSFASEMNDLEDAIQLNSAIRGKCDTLITRNKKDFIPHGRINVLTPEEFLRKGK
jgi:predicted nucleic acid-binding protein